MKTNLQIIADKCNGSIYTIDLINQDKVSSVNGNDVPFYLLALVSAKSCAGLLAYGMKVRNVNVSTLRINLAQYGIYINQRNAYDVMVCICMIMNDLGHTIPNNKLPRNLKPEDRAMLESYNTEHKLCDCGQSCCN